MTWPVNSCSKYQPDKSQHQILFGSMFLIVIELEFSFRKRWLPHASSFEFINGVMFAFATLVAFEF